MRLVLWFLQNSPARSRMQALDCTMPTTINVKARVLVRIIRATIEQLPNVHDCRSTHSSQSQILGVFFQQVHFQGEV